MVETNTYLSVHNYNKQWQGNMALLDCKLYCENKVPHLMFLLPNKLFICTTAMFISLN